MHRTSACLPFTRTCIIHCLLCLLIWLARFPLFACSVYCASKAGLTAFATSLSRELRHHNVFISIVEPGSYETDMNPKDDSILFAFKSRLESLPEEMKDCYSDESLLREFRLDHANHKFATNENCSPVIDQLMRSAVSQSPPELLIGVTSLTESLSIIFAQILPIDLTLKLLRIVSTFTRRQREWKTHMNEKFFPNGKRKRHAVHMRTWGHWHLAFLFPLVSKWKGH